MSLNHRKIDNEIDFLFSKKNSIFQHDKWLVRHKWASSFKLKRNIPSQKAKREKGTAFSSRKDSC